MLLYHLDNLCCFKMNSFEISWYNLGFGDIELKQIKESATNRKSTLSKHHYKFTSRSDIYLLIVTTKD